VQQAVELQAVELQAAMQVADFVLVPMP